MSVSRAVALLTPLFAALAGYVTVEAAKLPGAPALDTTQLTVVFVGGATAAAAAALQWLHGRAAHERQALGIEHERNLEDLRYRDVGVDVAEEDSYEPDMTVDELRVALGFEALEADIAKTLAGVGAAGETLDRIEAHADRIESHAAAQSAAALQLYAKIPERPHVDHHPV